MSTGLKLTFLGAAGTVTGSKYLVEASGTRVLVDCGLFQGLKRLRERNWRQLPLDASTIDAVVLTHAHLDHSGYLPVLIKRGFTGTVYCTGGTRALCGILLPDSGHLQEEDARYANKKGFSKHRPALPLYTQEDAERALERFRTVTMNESLALSAGVSVRFHPVYLNSPMAINATDIYCAHQDEHRLTTDECRAMCNVATYVNSVDDSKALNDRRGPMIIISASGMATGGRILHHLKAFAGDPRNTILFVGYQAAGTRGAALVGGASEVRIHGQQHKVRAKVTQASGLSAHADHRELVDWLKPASAPSRCFITHGVPTASAALKAQLLNELGWRAEVPNDGDTVSIRLRA